MNRERNRSWNIKNYRAIENAVTIDIERDKIVPLIGANESGKTTILQAVYAFDYANDKEFEGRHLKNLRNFYNPKNKEDAQVSAVINIKKEEFLNCISNEQLRNKYSSIEDFTEIKITRNLLKLKYEVSIIENEDDLKFVIDALDNAFMMKDYNPEDRYFDAVIVYECELSDEETLRLKFLELFNKNQFDQEIAKKGKMDVYLVDDEFTIELLKEYDNDKLHDDKDVLELLEDYKD